jgi:hypothetical protein
LGRTFESATRHEKQIDSAVSAILVQLIGTNASVKSAITSTIGDLDRQWQNRIFGRLGFAIWSVVLLAIGILLERFLPR